MVTVKQVRDKRKEVDALRAAYAAAEQARKDTRATYEAAVETLNVAKGKWIVGRDALEELGREFALDEGENDSTPPISFEPPEPAENILKMPILKVKMQENLSISPGGVPISGSYDPNRVYVVKRKVNLADDNLCACNESKKKNIVNGLPCVYHKERGEFRSPNTTDVLYWPLQEDDDIPF